MTDQSVAEPVSYCEINRQTCKDTARKLKACMVWATTTEGHDYWSQVYSRLMTYASRDNRKNVNHDV